MVGEGGASAGAPSAAAPGSLKTPGINGGHDGNSKDNRTRMKNSNDKNKDIWTKIVDHNKAAARATGGDRPDSHLFVVGSPRGGKSTLIARFLDPEKKEEGGTKQTRGLEYSFIRRQLRGGGASGGGGSAGGAMDSRKEVAHIWEISGTRELSEAIANREGVFLSLMTLATSIVLIVVDLSKPHEVLETLLFWLKKIRERAESCYRRLLKRGSKLPEQMMARSRRQFGLSHEDRDQVHLIGIPIVIAATKYDVFKSQEAEPCKIMARVLRYFAHLSGAYLVYLGGLEVGNEKEEGGVRRLEDQASRARSRTQGKAAFDNFRALLNHLLFFIPVPRVVEVDHGKMLCVPVGSDKFRDISRPKASDGNNANASSFKNEGGRRSFAFQNSTGGSTGAGSNRAIADDDQEVLQWWTLIQNTFPTPTSDPQRPWSLDPDKYKEPDVDALKAQKEAEMAEGGKQYSGLNAAGNGNLFRSPPLLEGVGRSSSTSLLKPHLLPPALSPTVNVRRHA